MADSQYFHGLFSQLTSQSCLVDLTPPTFAGIASATALTSGAIEVTWLAGSDATPPIEYRIYIALGSVTAADLFAMAPTMHVQASLKAKIFNLNDQDTYLVKGQVYTVGVRAEDGVGNIDSNLTILTVTAIASGNLVTVLQDIADQLDTAKDQIEAAASAITAGAGVQVSLVSTELTMTIEEVP